MSPETTLASRSGLVAAANRLLPGLYAARMLGRPTLEPQAILAGIERETGLADYDGDWFRAPLEVLARALREEARLNGLGLFAAAGQLGKVLKDRLRAAQLFKDNPQIARRSLASPVIVVGPMRSGTTRLHRLLAADKRFAHMRAFETVDPVPPLGFAPGDTDRRRLTARLALGAVHLANPTTRHIHPSGLHAPEEELGLLVRSLWGMKHEAQWHVPSYGRWCETQDATPAYEYMAKLLQLVGWARGEDDAKPWVLKTPQHMIDLDALLRVFPDARIIFTHRAPRSVVGSSCSLVWNQMIIHSDDVRAGWIGQEWLRKTEVQVERMRKSRLRIAPGQRIDVRYEDMERDWRGVMRRIYDFLDLDIEPALATMGDFIENSGRTLHRHPHRYSLEAFGLDPEDVDARFRSYVDAFDLGRARAAEARPAVPLPDMTEPAYALGPRDWTPAAAAARR